MALALTMGGVATELNYQKALYDASHSDGTDMGIEHALMNRGFHAGWQDPITFKDKFRALRKYCHNLHR